jgi:cytidylate kinase
MRTQPQIAIDGPAGVGKSTIGERLARRLGAVFVDTGAFYRTLTAVALKRGVAPGDGERLLALARALAIRIVPPTVQDGRQYTVLVDGEDMTRELRRPAVDAAVSQVSNFPEVRVALIERMREMAGTATVVMVGRDIGSVVLADADLKIYLTTSIEERARRRHGDVLAKYGDAGPTLEVVRREIEQRDALDAENMRPALDAMVINNDHLQADEVVERILALLAERGAASVGSATEEGA